MDTCGISQMTSKKSKDLLEAIKRKNADTTRYDLDEMYFKALLYSLTDRWCIACIERHLFDADWNL